MERQRCDHCKKWISQGTPMYTLEGLVSKGVDFNHPICQRSQG